MGLSKAQALAALLLILFSLLIVASAEEEHKRPKQVEHDDNGAPITAPRHHHHHKPTETGKFDAQRVDQKPQRHSTLIRLTTSTTTTVSTTAEATRSSAIVFGSASVVAMVGNGTIVTTGTNGTTSTSTFVAAPSTNVATDLGNMTSQVTFPLNATSYAIGALVPLTLNGTASLSGVQFAEAFKCQLSVYNNNGRTLPNTLLTYYIQDSQDTPSDALFQTYLLNRKSVPMIVGPYYDIQFQPVEALCTTRNTPLISYGVGAVQYANTTLYPTFYRTLPSDQTQARAMAQTFKIFGWNFIVALFTNDIYGQSGKTALIAETGRQRIKVTCSSTITPNSTRGLANFASCVSQSEASVVVLWMGEMDAANTISFLYINATVNSRLTFVAPDAWSQVPDPTLFNQTTARTNYSFPLSFINGKHGHSSHAPRNAGLPASNRQSGPRQDVLFPHQPRKHQLPRVQRSVAGPVPVSDQRHRHHTHMSRRHLQAHVCLPLSRQREL